MKLTNSLQRDKTVSSPRRKLACLIVFAIELAVLTAGCGKTSRDQKLHEYPSQIEELAVRREHADPQVEAQIRGRDVFLHYCQICHGDSGQGDGFNSSNLAITPRDFSDKAFWKNTDAKHLTTVIAAGGTSIGKSVLMPAWGQTLSQDQIRDLVAYLPTVPAAVQKAAEEEAAEEEAAEETE